MYKVQVMLMYFDGSQTTMVLLHLLLFYVCLSLSVAGFLQSLAKTLLSLETPTRGKYILLTLLTQHVPVGTILETSPDLPQELLRAMGHQVLACHVSLIMCSAKAFPIQLLTFCTKCSYMYSVFLPYCTLLGD